MCVCVCVCVYKRNYIKNKKYYQINKVGRSTFKISGAQWSFGFLFSKLAIILSRDIFYACICGHDAFSIASMFFSIPYVCIRLSFCLQTIEHPT